VQYTFRSVNPQRLYRFDSLFGCTKLPNWQRPQNPTRGQSLHLILWQYVTNLRVRIGTDFANTSTGLIEVRPHPGLAEKSVPAVEFECLAMGIPGAL
jgi:hypothetical protein